MYWTDVAYTQHEKSSARSYKDLYILLPVLIPHFTTLYTMSLPLATKEISHHPGKNAVTSPTDKAAMQADVDRKVRLIFYLNIDDAFKY